MLCVVGRYDVLKLTIMNREWILNEWISSNNFLSASDAFRAIAEDVTSASQILLNVEYEANGVKMASILNASNKEDVAKGLISEGRGSRDGWRTVLVKGREYWRGSPAFEL